MADIPDPPSDHYFKQPILEEYCSNLPDSDQKIVRKYCNAVSRVNFGLRDTIAGINKTEDQLVQEAVDQVCVGIPEKQKKRIFLVLKNTFQYIEPRNLLPQEYLKPGILQPETLIPGSNCHYTKEYLLMDHSLKCETVRISNMITSSGAECLIPSNFHMSLHHIQSTSKVTESNYDLNKYQKIKIIDLVPGIIHSNKVIYAKVCVDELSKTTGCYTIIEDEYGQCARIGIYNITKRLLHYLIKGTKIAIVNPFYKCGLDGFHFIRIDSPDEVLVIIDEEEGGNKSSEDHKKEGNKFFDSAEYHKAIECYTRAIEIDKSNPVYLRNRAFCFVKLELYEEALLDSEAAVKLDPNNHKCLYRMATAWSGLGDHEKSVNILQGINKNVNSSDVTSFLKTERTLLTNARGEFDFDEIEKKLKQGEDVVIGDYIGPVAIGPSPTHGHGVFATRDIQKGELLVVCKAVAYFGTEMKKLEDQLYHEYLEFNTETDEASGLSTCERKIIQILTEKISTSKLSAFRIFYLHNKRLNKDSVNIEIYTGKGYHLIRDKAKPPYQAELIRTIASQNMFSVRYENEQSLESVDVISHAGIWLLPSYINHSCNPNTYFCILRDICIVRACSFIPKNGELTLSCLNLFSEFNLGERRASLKKMQRFCNCNSCEFESDANNTDILQRAIDLRIQSKLLSQSNPTACMKQSHFKLLNQVMALADELNLGPKRFNADVWKAFHYLTHNFSEIEKEENVMFLELYDRARSYLCEYEMWHQLLYWKKLRIFTVRFCKISLPQVYKDEVMQKYQEIDSIIRVLPTEGTGRDPSNQNSEN